MNERVVFFIKSVNLCILMKQVLKIISFLTVALILFAAELLQAQPQRAYERGLEELYRNNTTRALDIWYSAYDSPGGVDARIGFEFIRVVTEERRREYYEQATELYYRALLDGRGSDSRVAIRQEIDRMRPLIGEGIYRQWNEWWSENNTILGSDMRGFWVQHDPTPSRVANERLIEHWQRIAVSKKRFTRNSNTVYGTDDRALIYIRYGEPTRTRSGILTLQSHNIANWLSNQLNPYAERNPEQSRRDDRIPQAQDDHRELVDRLQDLIYEYHRYPEYEVWFYDGLALEGEDTIPFFFGTDVRNEEFRLQTSIEDFIPERAYFPDRGARQEGVEFTRAGLTPALMLQMLYYEQLVHVDPLFENRLNELREKVLEQGIEAFQGMDLAFKAESRELLNQRRVRAPQEVSTYSDLIPYILMNVYQYRFLDENQQPALLTYIESSAQEAFLIDFHRNRMRAINDEELSDGQNVTETFPFYEMTHTIQEYDDKWDVKVKKEHHPPLILNRLEVSGNISRTLFETEHKGRYYRSASAELMNYDPDTRTLYETPFSSALRGLNRQQFRLPKPLVSHTDTLEMADLVLGFKSDDIVIEPFSFRVANDALIPFEETLVLHFEVYNLKRRDDDTRFTQFELTYRILPVDEEGKVRTDQAEFVLTLNFINEERHVIEDLEIETADLSPGLYDLRVRVIDTVTSQEKQRTIRFEVVE
jgi:GWxTD domain-containing protein